MRKLLLAIGAVITVSLGLVSIAQADNGPHGGYTDLTDKCAGCHRAHTALGASLLSNAASPTDKSTFCYACHSGGLGAYTDVRNGLFADIAPPPEENTNLSPNTPLKGGGFESVTMNSSLSGTVTVGVTSKHEVSGGSNTVWGFGSISSSPDPGPTNVALTCTNCHNPHGRAGSGNTATYRLLKGNNASNPPLFESGLVAPAASVDVADEAGAKTYYISQSNGSYFGEPYASVSRTEMSNWCSQCHQRHAAGADSARTDSTDAIFKYRHASNATAGPGAGCLGCHVAHGSGATVGTFSQAVAWPGQSSGKGNDSSLLRLDNRGVCSQCHVSSDGTIGTACLSCHGSGGVRSIIGNGKHDTHTAGDLSVAAYGDTGNNSTTSNHRFGCGTCHPLDSSLHRNSAVNTEMANVAAPIGSLKKLSSPGGTYSAPNCNNIYCHSNARGTYQSPAWNGGSTTCTTCHGAAPNTGQHSKHMGQTGIKCNTCHLATAYQLSISNKANHVNGRPDLQFDKTNTTANGGIYTDSTIQFNQITPGSNVTCSNTCHYDGNKNENHGSSKSWY